MYGGSGILYGQLAHTPSIAYSEILLSLFVSFFFLKRIPPKFRKNLLNELSERATLNLNDSSNCSWTVEVSQTEGEIYFKNGWQKFTRDNSLGNYEFLVFRYERDMQFSIEIFDRTACKRTKFPDVRTHRGQGRANKCDNSGIWSQCFYIHITLLEQHYVYSNISFMYGICRYTHSKMSIPQTQRG